MDRDDVLDTIRHVFPNLSRSSLQGIYKTARVMTFPAEVTICRQGAAEDTLYIMIEGEVDVIKTINGKAHHLATKRRGNFFGEMALITNSPRSADVVTRGPVTVLAIAGDAFHEYMETNIEVMRVLNQMTMKLLKRHLTMLNRTLPPAPPAGSVFVCYAKVDAPFVLELLDRLDGIDFWLDSERIQPGENWSAAVNEALETCSAMLLVLSPASIKSERVKGQWGRFIQQRPVVPVIAQPVSVGLGDLQPIDFVNQTWDAALEQLTATLNRLL